MREPEWTAENMNRKSGDTTFVQCGWCEHASCGSCRYSCYLETSCSLMKRYGIGRNVKWDTKCVVKNMGKKDFESVIKSKQYYIKESEDSIKRIKNEIQQIKKLDLKTKPPLPDHRDGKYDKNEVLYVCYNKKWNRGVCVSGYRSGDGCVSYVLDDYPKSKEGWGCGVCVPGILKEWEYEYFKKYKQEFKDWLDLSNRKYNGEKLNVKEYFDAM